MWECAGGSTDWPNPDCINGGESKSDSFDKGDDNSCSTVKLSSECSGKLVANLNVPLRHYVIAYVVKSPKNIVNSCHQCKVCTVSRL